MKKLLFFFTTLILLCLSVAVNAQSPVLYEENFDGMSSESDLTAAGWISYGASGCYIGINTSYSTSGSNSLLISAWDGNNNSDSEVAGLPVLSEPINTLQITLSYRQRTGGIVRVGYLTDPDDASTFVSLQNLSSSTSAFNTVTVDLSNAPANAARIAIQQYTWYDCYIDDIEVKALPTCMKPQNLAVTLTPGNGSVATLTWQRHANGTEDAWVLEYCTNPNFTDATSVNVTGGTPSKELTTLTAETKYYARVKADCGGGDESEWSNPISFTPTDAYILSLNEGSGTNSYVPIYYYYINNQSLNTASQFIIPASDLNSIQWANIEKLTFYANTATANYGNAEFTVYAGETAATTQTSFTNWNTLTEVYTGSVSVNNNMMEITFDNPFSYTTGNLLIGIKITTAGTKPSSFTWKGVSGLTTGVSLYSGYSSTPSTQSFLPQVTISYTPGEAPSCLPISDLAVTLTPGDGTVATLTWTENGSASDWVLQYGTNQEFTVGSYTEVTTGFSVEGTTVTANLTSLTAETKYYARVKANCGNNGESDWSFITNFTPTNAITVNSGTESTNGYVPLATNYKCSYDQMIYTADQLAAAGITGPCSITKIGFKAATANTIKRLPTLYMGNTDKSVFSSNTDFISINNLTTVYVREYSDNTSDPDLWTITAGWNEFELDEPFEYDGTSNLVIAMHCGQATNYNSTSFNHVATTGNQVVYAYNDNADPIPATYEGTWSTYSGTKEVSTKLPVLRVFATPLTCPRPLTLTASDITTDEASLSWTENGSATEWQICINGDEEHLIDVTVNPYPLTSLTPGTNYAVKVRANCWDNGFSEWSSVYNFITEATCTEPSGLQVVDNSVEARQAQISWTAGGEETTWDIYYSTSNTAPTSATAPTVNATPNNPYTITELTPNGTTYYVWVRAHCGDEEGQQSPWIGGISFTTACDAVTTFPWREDFEGFAAATSTGYVEANKVNDPCWLNEHYLDGTGYSGTMTLFQVCSYTQTGNSTNKLQLPDMKSGTQTLLRLPEMTLPSNNYQFVIDFLRNESGTSYTSEGVRVYASTDGEIDGATELGFLYRNCSQTDGNIVTSENSTGWYTYEFPIPFSGTCYIILRGESQYGSASYMDNLVVEQVPTCRKPSALMLETPSSRTAHTATLKWTNGAEGQNAWQIAYKAGSNFDPNDAEALATATIADVTTNPATIGGLAQSTTYYAYVRANCGDEYSSWSVAYVNFQTLAGNATPTGLAVAANTITSDQATASWNAVAGNTLHQSYDIYWVESPDAAPVTAVPENPTAPNLISGITATSQVISDLTPETKYRVWVRDNCGTDGLSAWSSYVTFTTASACNTPSNLVASNVTNNSAQLSWAAYGIDDFNLQYRVNGEEWDDNNIITNVNTPYILSLPLTGNTTYQVRVQATCAEDPTADASWSNTVSFTTACDPESMPWSENFDTWTSKSVCWSFRSGQYNMGQGTPTTYSSAWTLTSSYGSYITIDGKALTMNLYSSNKYWAVTPAIDITADDAVLKVDVAVAAWSSATPNYDDNDTLAFAISTDGGATFTNLRVLDGDDLNNLGNDYTTIYVPVAGYNGQAVRFAIYGGSINNVSSSNDNRCVIDNVSVEEAPSCYPVGTLTFDNVTPHSVDLSWDLVDNSQTTWYVQYATMPDFLDAEGYIVANTNEGFTLGLPLAETHYYVRVRANCGAHLGEWSNVIDINTGVACAAPTDLELDSRTTNSLTVSWTDNASAARWTVCYKAEGDEYFNCNQMVNVNPYTIEGLEDGTNYIVKVRANCGGIYNDESQWLESTGFFQTEASCPAPENLAVTQYSETAHGATITWEGEAPNFIVEYGIASVFNFSESFDGDDFPDGWSIMGLGTDNWSVSSSDEAGGTSGEMHLYYDPTFDGVSRLVLPAMDLTGISSVTFSFKQYLDLYGNTPTLGIATSSDGGTTWHTGWSHSYSSNNNDPVSEVIATEDMGQANVLFCIYFSGNSFDDINDWYFDDIVITGGSLPTSWTVANNNVSNNANAGTYTFNTLDPETTYYARVKGNCGSTTSPSSNFVSFTTLIACPAPTDLTAGEPTTESVELSWTENRDATAWQLRLNGDDENLVDVYSDDVTREVNNINFNLEGLDESTSYSVEVRANCGELDGNSVWSNPTGFTTLESCGAPTAFTLGAVNAHEASFSWTAGNGNTAWKIYVKKHADAEYPATFTDANIVNATINELDATTTYDVKIVPTCDDTKSLEVENAFTTECDAITITDVYSYEQNFNTPVVTSTYNSTTGLVVPSCWENPYTTGSSQAGQPHIIAAPTGNYSYNYSTDQVLNFYGSGNNYVTLPEFTNDLSDLQISFKWATEGSSTLRVLTLGYITAADDGNYSSFTAIGNGYSTPNSSAESYHALKTETVYLNTVPAEATRLVFRWYSSDQYSCNIDDVVVSLAPSCYPVGTLAEATNITATSADLSWTLVDNNQESWRITYATNAELTEDMHAIIVNSHENYTLDGLTPETHYYVAVSADCGPSIGGGAGSNIIDFTTDIACDAPTALTLDSRTTTSLTVSWTENGSATSWIVGYKAEGEEDFHDNMNVTENPYTIEGLTDGTNYTVRVKSNCSNGYPSPELTSIFQTEASCPAPTNLAVTANSETAHGATLTWTAGQGNDSYVVEYRQSSILMDEGFEDGVVPSDWTKVGIGTVNIYSTASQVHTDSYSIQFRGATSNVIALPAFTTETNQLKVSFWSKAEGNYSQCGNFEVGYITNVGDATTFVPVGDSYNYSNYTSYQLVSGISMAGAPDGARIAFRHTPTSTSYYWFIDDVVVETIQDIVWNEVEGSITANTYEFTTLDPVTSYQARVKGKCGESESSYSNVVNFTTLESCPTPTIAANATATNIGVDQATINWTSNNDHWDIYYSTDNTTPDENTTPNVPNTTDKPYTLTDLTANTTYYAWVRTNCGNETSAWSGNYVTFTTKCDAQPITYTFGFEADEADKFDCWKVISGNITRKSSITYAGTYRLDFRGSTSNMIILPRFTEPTNTLRVELYTRPESTNSNCGKFSIGYLTDPNDASTFQGIDTVSVSDWSGTVGYEFLRADFNKTDVPANATIALRQFDCAYNYYWYVDDITVKLIPSCEAVSGLTVVEPSAYTVALSWTPGASQETNWKLQYRMDGTQDWNTVDVAATDLNEGVYTLYQLSAETTYNWQVAANCGNNDISEYIAGANFTTLEACPKPTNLTLSTGSETAHGATLTWTAGSAANEHFTVEYSVANEENWIEIQSYIEETTYTINTLDPETSYQVRVSAICGTYPSGYSNVVEFTTLEACPAPAGLAADNATHNTVDLTWNATDAQTYNIQYRTAAGYDFSFTEGFEDGTMPEGWTTVPSSTSHDWAVRAGTGHSTFNFAPDNSSYNAGIYIQSYTYPTTSYLITPSMDLSGLASATLSFQYLNPDWSGGQDELHVYYRVNGGDWQLLQSYTNNQSSWTSSGTIALTGLAANYQIGFYATNDPDGDYGYGIGIDDVTILGGEYHEAGQWQTVSTADNTTSLQLPNLVASTNYEVQVQGVCDNTPGNWSSSVNFTTAAIPEYTVTFIAGNSGTCNTQNLTGVTVVLPAATPLQDCAANGWTFAGWTTTELTENTTTAPTPLYEAGTSYTPSASLLMYAVYMRTEGEAVEASYNLVTEAPTDWSGDYLIVYTGANTAFNSSLQTLDASSNVIDISNFLNNSSIASNATTDAAKVTIAAMTGGYSILAANGKYIGSKNNNDNQLASETTPILNTISLVEGNADIVSSLEHLRCNVNNNNVKRFRYYKSTSYTAQNAIQLYRYTSATPVTYAGAPDCSIPVSYNITVTQVQGASITAPSTAAAGDEIQLSIVPEDGYALNEWQVTTSTGPVTVTNNSFVMPAANVNVSATLFNVYTVAATAVPADGGTVTGAGSFNENTEVTLTANTNDGYDFTGWYNGDDQVSPDNSYTFTVTGNVTLEARFAERHTVTFNAGNGSCATTSLEGSTIDLSNVVALPSDLCANQGWIFAGWSETSVDENTPAPVLVNTIYSPASDIELYAVYSKTDAGAGNDTWTMASSIAVGDVVVMVYEGNVTKELTGVNSNIGTATDYTILPAGTYPLTVEQGNIEGTYAFKNNSNYLALTSDGNNLYQIGTLNNTSSWTVEITNGNAIITNVNFTDRVVRYNSGSPRFACYKGTQQPVQLYKLIPGDVTTYNSNPTCISSYDISATSADETQGTVSGMVGAEVFANGTYNEGTEITLTATANEGYTFVNWTKGGETVSYESTYTFTVTEDASFVANFSVNSYNITANVAPANSGSVEGAGSYTYGSTATLTATAATGYHFVNWTEGGNVVSPEPTYSFTVEGNRNLLANFTLQSYEVTVTANPTEGGTVSGAGSYEHGATATLTANAHTGYSFVSWTKGGEVVSTSSTYEAQVTETAEYIANFALNSYEVNATTEPIGGGSVSGTGTYNHGATATLTATANDHYNFVNWTEGGNVVSTEPTCSFTVEGNRNLLANFTLQSYEVTVTANPTEGGTVTGAGTYIYNTNATLTATANTGYSFVNWTKSGEEVSTYANYTITAVTAADEGEYVANFELTTYNITVETVTGGTLYTNTQGTATMGTTVTLSYDAADHYDFNNWTVTNTTTDQPVVVENDQFTMPAGNVTVSASFTLQGTVATPTFTPGEGTYDEAQSVTLNCSTEGATIYYTTDGTEPTTNSSVYEEAITTGGNGTTTTIKAIAIKSGMQNSPVATATYTIRPLYTVTISEIANGTVTADPTSAVEGATITLTPTPNTGYHFGAWDVTSGAETITVTGNQFTMPAGDVTVNASFEANVYTVAATIDPTESGSVNGTGSYSYGAQATLNAVPAIGYEFVRWEDQTTDANRVITVTGDVNVTAYFALKKFNISATANPNEGGSVTGANIYDYNATATLTATTNTGYTFVNWTEGGQEVSTEATYSFQVTGARTLVANFTANEYTITYMDGQTQLDQQTYDYNAEVTAIADPSKTGYTFVAWNPALPDNMPAENLIVNAQWQINNYNLTVNQVTGGTISVAVVNNDPVTENTTADYNALVTLTATPAANHLFSNWNVSSGETTITVENNQFNMPAGNVTVTAVFTPMDVVSTPTFNPIAGIYYVAQNVTINCATEGASIYYTMDGSEPSTASTLYNVAVTINETTTLKAIAVKQGMANSNVATALYRIVPKYNVVIADNIANGTVNALPTSDTTGATITLTADPATGYHFASWHVTSGNEVIAVNNNQFIMPAGNVTVSASFEANVYTVAATIDPTEGGSVSGTGDYAYGTTATLTATANEGYTFINWTEGGQGVSTNATYEFNVTGARSLVANFTLNSYDITVSANPTAGGTVSGGDTYNHGATVTLTATANEGYTFTNWTKSGEEVSTESTYSFAAEAAGDYVANFTLNSYEITATANPAAGGTVTGAGTYSHGANVTLTAMANEGYTFTNWTKSGEEVSTQSTYSFAAAAAGDYVANFTLNSYDITVSADPTEGGAVSGAGTYNHGADVTLTATANEGYTFVNWTKGGESVSTNPTCTLAVTGAAAYVAHFSLNSYAVTANVNPAEGGSVTGAGTYSHGANVTLTAIANNGYHFVNWTENDAEVSTDASYSFTFTGARNLVANFAITSAGLAWSADNFTGYTMIDFNNWKPTLTNTHNVSVRFGCVEGNLSSQGGVEVNATTGMIGDEMDFGHIVGVPGTYHIYAVHDTDPAYYYDSVVYTLNVESGVLVALLKNIDEAGTAVFADYTTESTLTHSYGTEGLIAIVAHDQTVRVQAEPATGYHFSSWQAGSNVDGYTPVSTDAIYTYTVPDTMTVAIKAVFDTNTYALNVVSANETMGIAEGSTTAKHFLSYQISATPNTGYHFTQWSDGNTQNPRTVTLTENTTYTAEFAINNYTITATADPTAGGSVEGAGNYNHFANATLTATAETGYTFTNWTENGNVVTATNPYVFEVTGARELVAHFSLNTYAVSASANPANGGTVIGAGTYNHGATVTMEATPAAGYAFVNWTEGGQEVFTDASYTFTFTEGRTLVANFTPISYTVTFEAGTGSCQTGSLTGSIESSINIDAVTATPEAICGNQDWVFAGWSTASVGETDQAPAFVSGTEYIPTDNITLYAVYTKTEQGEGTWANATSIEVGDRLALVCNTKLKELSGFSGASTNYGTDASYAGSPAGVYPLTVVQGYNGSTYAFKTSDNTYLSWSSGNSLTTRSNIINESSWNVTFAPGNATILNAKDNSRKLQYNSSSPRFACYSSTQTAVQLYKYTASSMTVYNSNPVCYVYAVNVDQNIEHGSVVADQTTDIVAGTEITLTPTPATGYHFGSWIVTAGNDPVTVENNKFTMPESNVNVSALFWIDTLTVNVNANPAVGGTVSGAGDYEYGDMVTLNATANTGYTFVNWTENNQEVSADATYEFTFNGEAGTRTFVANFSLNSYEITVSANPTEGGNVNGGNTYNHGATANLTANPATGYHFVNWTKDGDVVSTSANYSFTVAGAGSYVANFELNSYTIAATSNPTAGGTVSGAGTYNHFENVTLTATVSNGYDFIGWYRGNDQVATSLEYSFEATEDVTLEARFATRYTVRFSTGSHSTTTIEPIQGSSVNPININALTADPSALCVDQDWVFAGWSAASVDETTQAPAFVSGTEYVPTDNITLYAVYSKTEGVGSSTASIDFTAQGYTNAQAISDVAISNNVNVTFAQGTNHNNAPKYYNSGSAIRCYGGNTFTVTATDAAITNITLTFGSEDGSNYISPDNGDYSNGTWTGNENSVVFTISGTSGNRRIAGMSVTTFGGIVTYNSDPECFVYDVVVNPNEHGTIMADPNTGVIAGTPITLTNTPSEGYHFAGWDVTTTTAEPIAVSNNQFIMPESDVNVSATFEPDTFTLTINYMIDGSAEAPATYETRLAYGTDYSVTSPDVTGYTPDMATVTGTMGNGNVVLTVTYNVNSYNLTIHYVAEGTTAPVDYSESYSYGTSYSVTSPAVTGYTPSTATVTGIMGTQDVELTVTYSVNNYTLTILYQYTDGTTAAQTYTDQVNYNETYSVSSPEITGYTASQTNVSGTMPAEDVNVTVTYATDVYTLTIHYVYADNTQAANDESRNLPYGTEYSVNSPNIEGYTADQLVVSGTMGEGNVEVTVRYTINSQILTVNYLYEDGTTQAADPYTATLNYHDTYSVTTPRLDGYVANKSSVAGTMGDAEVTVNVTYYLVQTSIVDATNCEGTGTGSLTVAAPVGNFEYSLDGVAFQSTTQFATLNAGDYTLYIRPVNEEYNYAGVWTVNSSIAMPVAVVSSNDSVFCLNASIDLDGTGSSTGSEYSYAWVGPNNYSSTAVNPAPFTASNGNMSGTYTLTVTSSITNCSTSNSLSIHINHPSNSDYAFTISAFDAVGNIEIDGANVIPNILTPNVNHFMDNVVTDYSSTVSFLNNAPVDGYSSTGVYPVMWTAEDACGNTATTSITVRITRNECPFIQDIDGNIYLTVKIGEGVEANCWMAENLRSTRFADGRPLTNIYQYDCPEYPNVESNVSTFGLLYDWYDAMDSNIVRNRSGVMQGICPNGWHIPSDAEFNALNTHEIQHLRSTEYWLYNAGDNATGFNMRPSGMYNFGSQRYENLLGNAYFWTADDTNTTEARCRMADCNCYMVMEMVDVKTNAYSIRCVRNR